MVADFCAGAGGKTLLLGALMRSQGRLYAFDIAEKRLTKLKPHLARSGLSNVHPVRIESEHDTRLKRLAGKFMSTLIHPSSGYGFRITPPCASPYSTVCRIVFITGSSCADRKSALGDPIQR